MYVYYAQGTFFFVAENENRHNGGALTTFYMFSRDVSAAQISATVSRKMKGTFILAFPVRV